MMTNAQSNIKSVFDAIIKCPEAQITESHTLDKDPTTSVKTGQSDIYNFVIPVSKENLISNVYSAFDKDAEMAYSINKGKRNRADNNITLAVGDGKGRGVQINNIDCEYIYSLFLAPLSEDPKGIYRYAYGMNCK